MTREQVIRGRVVTPTGVISDGVVAIAGDRIADVRPATGRAADRTADRTADHGAGRRVAARRVPWILPGFVDIHVHGGGGASFTSGDPDQARAAVAFHARHGTTTMLASLVTAPAEHLRTALAGLSPLVDGGVLVGIHLEGPYLSTVRRGAHDPAHLRDPDLAELTGLLDQGGVRMVTLAPERAGAIEAIRLLRSRGVLAAVGHTDASYEQTRAAIEAGATVATHLCNGMRPAHHREPGPITALLDAADVVCEQIADGVHLHEGMLRHVVRVAGPDRVALVTDAVAAAGMPDGEYELGGRPVTVSDGVARAADGAIAGSTGTMDAAVRHLIHCGISIVDAATMAATTPARVLGVDAEVGSVVAGRRADLVLMDDDLRVLDVLWAGAAVRRTGFPGV
jgi:N-acetylglucosamine-6-phosphate deacetylase